MCLVDCGSVWDCRLEVEPWEPFKAFIHMDERVSPVYHLCSHNAKPQHEEGLKQVHWTQPGLAWTSDGDAGGRWPT